MPKKKKHTHQSFLSSIMNEMLTLSTTGFGLVAALAWNDAIKTFIVEYIQPFTQTDSVLVSQLIYAVIITLLAVTITYELTVLKRKFANKSPK